MAKYVLQYVFLGYTGFPLPNCTLPFTWCNYKRIEYYIQSSVYEHTSKIYSAAKELSIFY